MPRKPYTHRRLALSFGMAGAMLYLLTGCATSTYRVPTEAVVATPTAPPRVPLVRNIAPSATHTAIKRIDDPHYVALDPARESAEPPLVLFMAGTGGKPRELTFFPQLLRAGMRVISITYNTREAIQQVCPRHPDVDCAAKVRTKRLTGANTIDAIDDEPADAIVPRLVWLLEYLHRAHPAEHWDRYLDNGRVNWSRVIVTGQSQGAGMAAFIAQEQRVARAVLFSSPWDSAGAPPVLASWLARPSATPPEKWFGGYHSKENTAALLARSYAALRIPPNHIRIWTAEPESLDGPNPYHGVGVSRFNTPQNIAFLFGLPTEVDKTR
jgi:predicted esterase